MIGKKLSNLVVLPHSVFALPFALASFLLAARLGSTAYEPAELQGLKGFSILIAIVIAVISARCAAMAFNRVVDRKIDALNPRTAMREIPAGEVSVGEGKRVVLLSALIFFSASAYLGMHCLVLSPIVLGVLLSYSYTKRFTSASHLVLGLALALAPGGAWWVLRPEVATAPLLLMIGVLFWVGGFDVLYSCQDVDFDRSNRLHSVPALCGVERAFLIARALHVLAFSCFISLGLVLGLPTLYFVGVCVLGAGFFYQHTLLSPTDLGKINRAFFTTNGIISLGYLLIVVLIGR